MKTALALALILPFVSPKKAQDTWQPYTSIAGRIRFEMPLEPVEQNFETQGGSIIRSFTCERSEVVYEANAIDMGTDLKMAIHEAVSDAEESVSRQVLNGMVEDCIQDLDAKAAKTEYGRFQKLHARITVASLPAKREVKIISAIGKDHVYMFIVSYPKGAAASMTAVKKFFDSVRFEN